MSLVLRIILAGILLVGVVIPIMYDFYNDYGMTLWDSDKLASSVTGFISTLSTYFSNIKGAINYLLFKAGGDFLIGLYNILIKLSLLFPVFALTDKLSMSLYYFIM